MKSVLDLFTNDSLPTIEGIDRLIQTLEEAVKIASKYENSFHMYHTALPFTKPGAVNGCAAGWYTVAYDHLNNVTAPRTVEDDYLLGAYLMYHDSGLPKEKQREIPAYGQVAQLATWARKNPHVWGNDYGHLMFCSGQAYFGDDFFENESHFNLQSVLNHWKYVVRPNVIYYRRYGWLPHCIRKHIPKPLTQGIEI